MAHRLEAQGVDAIQDSVQVGLIHNLTRKNRLTPGVPDLPLLEGPGETLAQLRPMRVYSLRSSMRSAP